MIPGPTLPPASPPSAPKRLENARNDPPKERSESRRFEAEAEGILEALAQGTRPPLPGTTAELPREYRQTGQQPGPRSRGGDDATPGSPRASSGGQQDGAFSKLNQARQVYGSAQQRQGAVLRQPGSLLNLEA